MYAAICVTIVDIESSRKVSRYLDNNNIMGAKNITLITPIQRLFTTTLLYL